MMAMYKEMIPSLILLAKTARTGASLSSKADFLSHCRLAWEHAVHSDWEGKYRALTTEIKKWAKDQPATVSKKVSLIEQPILPPAANVAGSSYLPMSFLRRSAHK
jgi:hypothetical protein